MNKTPNGALSTETRSSNDTQSVIHVSDFRDLRRIYRYILPLFVLSPLVLWADRTGFFFQIAQALCVFFAPFSLYGSYNLFFKYANAKNVRLEGSRISVGGTDISVHMTEILRCRLGTNFDGSPNVVILDLKVPRLFWVPGLMAGISKSAVFRVDESTADLAMRRIGLWLKEKSGDEFHLETLIRPASKQDAHLFANILNPIIKRGGTTAYEDPVNAAYFETMITNLGPRDTLFVAEDDGRVVGYQLLEASAKLPADVASIASFVAIGTTAKGVGQAMAVETIRAAKAAGWSEVDAKIRVDNAAGLAYYSRLGFQDHEVFAAVPLKDGTPVDRIAKRLHLT